MSRGLLVPDRSEIEKALGGEDVERWLQLWWVSQGGAVRNRRFDLMSASLPFDPSAELDVLDVCCGPGDLGRAIRKRFPRARIDAVDRDRFLLALAAELNRRRRIPIRVYERDGWDPDWRLGLGPNYHVIAAATALHWFDVSRLGTLFADFYDLLHDRGVFVFTEPVASEPEFVAASDPWPNGDETARAGNAWAEFWDHANAILGYDHRVVLKSTPGGKTPIGDDGIPTLSYVQLLRDAGFTRIDVLRRESRCVTIAALKG